MDTQNSNLFDAAANSANTDPTIHDVLLQPVSDSRTSADLLLDQTSSAEECWSLISDCKSSEQRLIAGTTLYHEGDVCKNLYFLLDGWVATCRSLQDGRQLTLSFLMKGAFLGFQSNLLLPMNNSMRCLTDSIVSVLPRHKFIALLEKHPDLLQLLTQTKAVDEKIIFDNLFNIATRPARARVARFLIDIHTRIVRAHPEQDSKDVYLPLTRQNIADALGLTNVHISRAMCAMQRENLFSFKNMRLQIHDFERLLKIANH
ncbi:MAG: Crp/Fnr family transcriptional regulator [Granulosicoccus sp.]